MHTPLPNLPTNQLIGLLKHWPASGKTGEYGSLPTVAAKFKLDGECFPLKGFIDLAESRIVRDTRLHYVNAA